MTVQQQEKVRLREAAISGLTVRSNQIEMFLLPGDSPEPKPDELLNQGVKSALDRCHPKDQADLIQSILAYFLSLQRQPAVV